MTKRRQRGEGALFQRASDGKWVGRVNIGWIDGKRRTKSVYGNTQEEARVKLRKAAASVAAGNVQTAGTTVEKWLTVWLAEVCPAKEKMRPRTLINYESYCRNYLVPCLGKVRLDRMGAQHVRQLAKYITGKGLSTTTAGHAHAILTTALNDAIREGLIERNPAELVAHPANAKNQRRSLTLIDVRALLGVLEGLRDETRWHAALYLGMRQGECLGLRWDRVDLNAGTVTIDTQLQRLPYEHGCGPLHLCRTQNKAHRCTHRQIRTIAGYDYEIVKGNLCLVTTKTDPRIVPMPEALQLGLIAQQWTEAKGLYAPTGLVWTTPDGSPIDGADDRARWHDLLRLAGIEDTDQHSARHTTATLLLALGVSEDVRMAILGHSVAATAAKYAHVDLTLSRRALGALESAIKEPHANSVVQPGTAQKGE